ncbi:unnamed protein product, partial [Mesorhabditis belari]|uniref:Enhancer of rudimentary homolog n=1 Tax=Mesorhabditis belari TaxID=2138241 RepID=A0AAF3FL50_9BILA
MHTILLLQPTSRADSRSYSDYESLKECLEAICKIYEEFLRKRNPGERVIKYDIEQLYDFLDKLTDVAILQLNPATKSYVPHNREWMKEKIFSMLRSQAGQ